MGNSRFSACVLLIILLCLAVSQPAAARQLKSIELSPLVVRLLDDETLSYSQRREMVLFHGQWNALGQLTVNEQAQIALGRFDLRHATLLDDRVTPLIRARAALLRGDCRLVIELLTYDTSITGATLRGRAYEDRSQWSSAIQMLRPWRDKLAEETVNDPAQLVAAAKVMVMLARLEGRPAQDYHLAMGLLAKVHQEVDRLYWPAKLSEARLLYEKDNARQAVAAIFETLALNPRCGEAWYLLGRIGLAGYNFQQVSWAIGQLRKINEQHLLADLLEVHMFLQQKDATSARRVVDVALKRYPRQRRLLALAGAVEAASFNDTALSAAFSAFDQVSPGGALAYYTVGRYLAMARQYDSAQKYLQVAIERFGNWSAPRLELGLLLMQSGDEQQALIELGRAAQLDPFQRRAANQLKLVEQLLKYEQIRTAHFVIKYQKGIDEALARDMPQALEQIYDDVTKVFGHAPSRTTLIEIMPDDQWFSIRITGMPEIWTIAASTGRVIALTPPRNGPRQRGTFDWENVMRHEFVHTVTLDLTKYRIPHWFTEACAVGQERKGRDYATCRLLAAALEADKLFDLDTINWAFARPKTPNDRPLAYAQSHWMLEYLTQTYGHQAVLTMLKLYRQGATNQAAIETVSGMNGPQFMQAFIVWARRQVRHWGLASQVEDARLDSLASMEPSQRHALLDELLEQYPDHPQLLWLSAQRTISLDDYRQSRQAVLRYAATRPVDPWSHRTLWELARKHDRPDDAIGSLEYLDAIEVTSGRWAWLLARYHRKDNRLDQAAAAITRALYREPYNGAYRELAAAIQLQRGRADRALRHVYALTVLEPDRAIQWARLGAVYRKVGQMDKAEGAVRKAQQLGAANRNEE